MTRRIFGRQAAREAQGSRAQALGATGHGAPRKDFWDIVHICGTMMIGVFGLCATAVIGYGQWTLSDAQRREDRASSLKQEFLESIRFAREDGIADCGRFLTSLDVAGAVAQEISVETRSNRYLDWVERLRAAYPKCVQAPAAGAASGSSADAVRQRESEASRAPVDTSRWFAVVGTFKGTEAGLGRARAWAVHVAEKSRLCTEVWKTRISDSYAVVIGSAASQGEALERAAAMRSAGTVPDAFTQVDRGWQRVGEGCAA